MSDRETGGQMVRAEGDALAPMGESAARAFEQVVIKNDLKQLDPTARVAYYHALCNSLGLNPLTRPFLYLELSGKLVLYATKDCTEQLRSNKRVSLLEPRYDWSERALVVTVTARTPDGRTDSDIGVADIGKRAGEALENAIKKAVTQAKRRVTLSICGLGALDASEVPDIPSAHMVAVDMETGEVLDHAPRGRVDREQPSAEPAGNEFNRLLMDLRAAETWEEWYTAKAALRASAEEHEASDRAWETIAGTQAVTATALLKRLGTSDPNAVKHYCGKAATATDAKELTELLDSYQGNVSCHIRLGGTGQAAIEEALCKAAKRLGLKDDWREDPWGDEPTGGEDGE